MFLLMTDKLVERKNLEYSGGKHPSENIREIPDSEMFTQLGNKAVKRGN